MEYSYKRSFFAEICYNQYSVSITLYRGVNAIYKLTFHIYYLMLVKIGMRFLKEMSIIYEFRANRHREDRTFLGR
jgi:hypothetical protein